MAHDEEIVNTSGNRPFEEVLRANLSRRTVLSGSLATAATAFLATSALVKPVLAGLPASALMDFTPAKNDSSSVPQISPQYRYDVLIPWGEPLDPGAGLAPFADTYPLSADEQEQRIGIGHDGMHFFPINGSNEHGVLCINHEFGSNSVVLGKSSPDNLDDVHASQAAHGVAVVEIEAVNGKWQPVSGSSLSRRITVNTEVEFSGPVAGSGLLDNTAVNPFQGTVNNCANGVTPWDTYLTCEENFNGYFGASGAFETPERERYGFDDDGFGYGWFEFDDRFDLSKPGYENEDKRFGWIVEIDPFDASAKPVKRTALGRFKHEGIALTLADDKRVVGYMGDDQRFDYIYKFVSEAAYDEMDSPLDAGTLYVAHFNDNGTGEWLPLDINDGVSGPLLTLAGFEDQASVLTFARLAADALGATPMDRPEWTCVMPNGDVFCTLTNNSQRTEADAANPEAPNNNGHIIKWTEPDGPAGTTFKWEIFVMATDTLGTDYEFTDPDGIACDPDGRLFIMTDGGQPGRGEDQMLVADPDSGEIRRLLSGVSGDEITGFTLTPDRRTAFVNTQHPGVKLPNFGGDPVPRDSTFVITRKNGGIIGS